MRINLRLLVLIVAVMILAAVTGKSDPLGEDPNQPDSIMIDSVIAYTSGSTAIPVYFYNDEELTGIELTLKYDSPDLSVDSFSFMEGRCEYVSLKGWILNDEYLTIYCMPYSTDALISPGNGLFGHIYLSFAPSISYQVVTIDTVSLEISDLIYASAFSDADATAFIPVIEKGYLDLKVANCCLGVRGNVNGDSEEKINISDITYIVSYLFGTPSGPTPPCLEEGNVNADSEGKVNISDLTYLVSYLYDNGPAPPSCP